MRTPGDDRKSEYYKQFSKTFNRINNYCNDDIKSSFNCNYSGNNFSQSVYTNFYQNKSDEFSEELKRKVSPQNNRTLKKSASNHFNSIQPASTTKEILNNLVNKTDRPFIKEENEYLKETVDLLNKNLTDLQIRINLVENQKNDRIQKLKNKNKVLKIKLKNEVQQNKSLKDKLEHTENGYEELMTKCINYRDQYNNIKNTNSDLIKGKELLMKSLDTLKEKEEIVTNNNIRSIFSFSFEILGCKTEFSIQQHSQEKLKEKKENLKTANEVVTVLAHSYHPSINMIKDNSIDNNTNKPKENIAKDFHISINLKEASDNLMLKQLLNSGKEDLPLNQSIKSESQNEHSFIYVQTNESFKEEDGTYQMIEINKKIMKNLDCKFNDKIERKSKKTEVIDGAKYIFRMYDKKSVLKFDIEGKSFRVIEFADFGDFGENYNPQGSIYLNIFNGMFIVTGKNHDMFYHFHYPTKTMTKLAKLNDNHIFGSLIIYEKENSLICPSGWHNRKVESCSTKGIKTRFFRDKSNKVVNKDFSRNKWSYLPEMIIERSECAYLIINDSLFAFFGYNCPRATYIDTIEKLNLSKLSQWEEIKYKNKEHISTHIKSHSCVLINQNDVVFLGGFDGLNESPLENFFEFAVTENELKPIDRKYPDIVHNHFYNFQNDSCLVPFIDIKSRLHFVGFDEHDRVHSIEVQMFEYDLFKFDY